MAGIIPDNWGLGYLTDFTRPRSNTLLGLSAGLLSGNLGNAPLYAMEGKKADDAYATAQKEEARNQEAINQTFQFLQQSAPQLAAMVKSGAMQPAEAYNIFSAEQRAKASGGPQPIEINGQLVDPTTGQVIGDYRNQQGTAPIELSAGATLYDPTTNQPIYTAPDKPSSASVPAGYRPSASGGLEFIPGGPADPATAGKTTEATRRNQQLAKVIVPEAQSLLGQNGQGGMFDALANGQDQARDAGGGLALGLGQGPSAEYQQAKNSLKTIIASYLYSVSGATANPGEVETQASVLTPKFGEDPKSVAAKKARIAQMVQAVVEAAKGTPIEVGASPAAGQVLTYNPLTGELE